MNKEYNTKIIRLPTGEIEYYRYSTPKQRHKPKTTLKPKTTHAVISDEMQKERTASQVFKIKRKIKYIIKSNSFSHFVTLTIDPKRANSKDFKESKQLLLKFFKAQRNRYGATNWLVVPELTPKNGYVHFHGVIQADDFKIAEAINARTGKKLIRAGKQVYNLLEWKHGFSDVEAIENKDQVSSYITKYLTKELITDKSMYKQPRYYRSRGLLEPEISYESLPDNYFDEFTPSFQVNTFDLEQGVVIPKTEIYKIKITDDGEFIQDNDIETSTFGLGNGNLSKAEALELIKEKEKEQLKNHDNTPTTVSRMA